MYRKLLSGVPQGSVLGTSLLKFFINDIIFAMNSSHVCNCADDNTVYVCDKDVESVARRLEDDIPRALDRSQHKRMVENPKNFQVMLLGLKQHQGFLLEVGNNIINVTRCVKLLGITVDDELKFDKHVKKFAKK